MPTKPEQTPEQIANCRKLIAYLRTLPADYPDFEMDDFVQTLDFELKKKAHVAVCGTAACAVGHGPVAGIAPIDGEAWIEYSERCFVAEVYSEDGNCPWDWCFAGGWSRIDNTVHGAADRIEYMLEHGVPEDAYCQRLGEAPLCYRAEPAK